MDELLRILRTDPEAQTVLNKEMDEELDYERIDLKEYLVSKGFTEEKILDIVSPDDQIQS